MRRVFTNWWFLTISLMLIVLLLLTFGLPIFVTFLKPLWVRLLLGALVFGTWTLFAVLRVRKGTRPRRRSPRSFHARAPPTRKESSLLPG